MAKITLNEKQSAFTSSRSATLRIYEALNWVEDAALNIIKKLEEGEYVAVYFRASYPKNFPNQMTFIGDPRRTILYRTRLMIQRLQKFEGSLTEFQEWRFAGLKGTMEILLSSLKENYAGNEENDSIVRLAEWWKDFARIWKIVGGIYTEEELSATLTRLLNSVDDVFLHACEQIAEKEKSVEEVTEEENIAASRHEEVMDKLTDIKETVENNDKTNKKAIKITEKVLIQKKLNDGEEEDEYSKYAHLEDFPESKRYELKKAIDFSHGGYSVERDVKGKNARSLKKLAAAVWLENKEEFENLAKLAGYKTVESFSTALYGLAKKYPSAAHFVWE